MKEYAQLTAAMDHTPYGVALYRSDSAYPFYVNDALCTLFEATPEALIKSEHLLLDRIPPQDFPGTIADVITSFLKNGFSRKCECSILCPHGKLKDVLITMSQVPLEHEYLNMVCVTDITNHAIRDRDKKYRLLVEQTDAAAFEWNLEDGSFTCTESFYKYELSTIKSDVLFVNSAAHTAVHPDDIPALHQFFSDSKKESRAETKLRLKMVDGNYRWSRMSGIIVRDESGKNIRVIGAVTDIDDEEQKSIMEESLINAIPGGIAIFKVDLDNSALICQYFSEGFARMSGRTHKEVEKLLRENRSLQNAIVPEDRERFMKSWIDNASAGKPLNLVYRCIDRHGDIYWSHMTATKIRVEDGFPVYYTVFTEPTDEALLYRTLVEDSSTAVLVAEKVTRRILYVNPAWLSFAQADRKERVIGRILTSLEFFKTPLITDEEILTLPLQGFHTFQTRLDDGRHLLVKGRSILWNGADAYILYINDETEQFLRQEELERNRTLLSTAMETAHVSVWVLDIAAQKIIQTPLSQKNHGFDLIINDVPAVFLKDNYVSPRTRAAFIHFYNEVFKGHKAQVDVEFKHPHTGEYHWERMICEPVFDKKGELVRAIGTSLNIDEQMKRKHQYEQQKKLFRMFASTSIATMNIDLKHNTVSDRQCTNSIIAKIMSAGSADEVFRAISTLIPSEKGKKDFLKQYSTQSMLASYRSGDYHQSVSHGFSILPGWYESSYSLIYNPYTESIEAVCILRDITQEKQAELAMNTLVDVDYDGIFIINKQTGKTKPFLCDKWDLQDAERQFSDPETAFRDYCEDVDDIKRVLYENSIKKIREELEDHKVYTTTFFVKAEDTIMRKRALYCYLDNDPDIILDAVQDYTEAYQKEEQQKKALETALAKARKASMAKTDFLSNMSHEIRTPMNAIIGMTKLAESAVHDNTESVSEYLNEIDQSSEYLLGLLNDILDMSRIESNKFELHREWGSGMEVINSCINMLKPQMKKKNITFRYPTLDRLPPDFEIYTDMLRLKQVLMNLLNNAWKFTPEGGHISLKIHNLSYDDRNCLDEIKIIDDGCGMSEEFLSHVFEPFSQEHNRFTGMVTGTGLGLPLTKKIVEAMNGTILIDSEKNKGTTIIVKIPYLYRLTGQPLQKSTSIKSDEKILSGKRVLLCEDHPLNAIIAQKLLEMRDMIVDRAQDGQAAVDLFLTMPEGTYAAILMDIRMPGMDGLSAAREIRRQNKKDAGSVPIIAMTANAFEEDREASRKAGMNAHLSKPIQPELLYETLAEVISRETRTGEYKFE